MNSFNQWWRLSHYLSPFKFQYFLREEIPVRRILDVGCGNHSASVTKYWFPRTSYFGIDRDEYNNSSEDYALMDGFIQADLDVDSLESIESRSFDLVIMSHVIEHLQNGERALSHLVTKLCPGGYFYIECPSERSLHLPSGVDCLNFYDDPTHIRVYNLPQVCAEAGLEVVKSGIRRDWIRALLGVTVLLPKQVVSLVRKKKLYGPALWDLLGFAQYVIARFPQVT
jgi:SAM-dependent methyltransferase